MYGYKDDEMRKQWEEVSREEETNAEGDTLHIEGMQRVPDLVASQLVTKGRELKKKKRRQRERWQDGLRERWMRKWEPIWLRTHRKW